jgi:hypothetical protein
MRLSTCNLHFFPTRHGKCSTLVDPKFWICGSLHDYNRITSLSENHVAHEIIHSHRIFRLHSTQRTDPDHARTSSKVSRSVS